MNASNRRLIERELRAAVPKDGPQAHLYNLVADYPSRGGKRIRPLLCMMACEAAGGQAADVIDASVALELLHNAFLVHDDIVDQSVSRRGAPSLNARFGVPLALNAGDGLFTLALERVAASAARHPRHSQTILAEFAHMLRRTVEGQAVELGWVADDRWDITDQQYLAMVRDKTAWYSFIHPLRIGTLLGSGCLESDQFVELGFLLGALFQIRDDLENLLGDPTCYDKDLGCDLVESKRTLPVLHLLHHGTAAEQRTLRRYLGRASSAPPSDRLAAVVPLMHSRGSIAHTNGVSATLAAAACSLFKATFGTHSRKVLPLIELLEGLLTSPAPKRRRSTSGAKIGTVPTPP